MSGLLRHHSSSSSSTKSDRSQLVDLVVEDTVAEETERVRARKEGSAGWNEREPKRFVRTYGEDVGEDIRSGFDPRDRLAPEESGSASTTKSTSQEETTQKADQFPVGEDDEPSPPAEDSEESRHWKEEREHEVVLKPKYGLEGEAFDNVWGGGQPKEPPKENP
jgi:hypothetical protein